MLLHVTCLLLLPKFVVHPLPHVMAAVCSLFKSLHCICVKSDSRIKEISSKKLKWILTVVALYSASNHLIMSTASTCSQTDSLRVFVGVWNRFSDAKIAYNISVNNIIFKYKIRININLENYFVGGLFFTFHEGGKKKD